MTKHSTLYVYLGRFQPLHVGHLAIIRHVLQTDPKGLLQITVGSSILPYGRTTRNPWTTKERWEMLNLVLTKVQRGRVRLTEVVDCPEDDQTWKSRVGSVTAQTLQIFKLPHRHGVGLLPTGKIVLVGHVKDKSSFYLKALFKEWKLRQLPAFEAGLSATEIRQAYFFNYPTDMTAFRTKLHPAVYGYLTGWRHSCEFEAVRRMFYQESLIQKETK